MKRTSKIISLLLAIGLTFSLAACSGKNNGANGNGGAKDGKTITVKSFEAGYGTTWLYKVKEKFEEVYKEEGYKVNILKPDNSLKSAAALADMRNSKKTGVDVYFVQSVAVANAIDEEYGSCITDLTDMYDLPAIKFDGTEEDVKISEKLSSTYDASVKAGDKYYSMLWASSPSGLIANTKVLTKYGLTLPKTTDELFKCFSVIWNGTDTIGGSSETKVYPFAWAGNNAVGYALYSLYTNLGQMIGQDGYNQFMSLQQGATITEDDIKNGKNMYKNDDIYTALEIMMKEFNTETSCPGSANNTHDKAHFNLLKGNCAFIPDGEFFFREAMVNYSDLIGDISFLNVPVNSELGVKLKLDGTGKNREKCDEILSYVIGLIDENKTTEQIIVAVSNDLDAEVTAEQIETITEARACYYERKDHNAYITSSSNVKDIAKLFLRMVASDDFGDLFNETAYAYAPYSRNNNNESEYSFVNDCFKIVKRKGAWGVSNLDATGLRLAANISLYAPYGPEIARSVSNTKCRFDTTNSADFIKVKNEIIETVNSQWAEKMKNAGYNV